ncbi:thymidylate synthase [Malassezia sp. CBS 17886]|nr:thymidylate synthase [Malassezia sp. CBS 17886]
MPTRAVPRLIVIRHGTTEWALNGKHTGRTDIPLTAAGVEEARAFGDELVGRGRAAVVDLDALGSVFRSPRDRCKQTMEQVLAGHEGETPPARIVDDMREWDYGAYEGEKTHDIRVGRPGWDIFQHGAPDHATDASLPGESVQQISDRADRVVAVVRQQHESTHKDVVVFTHGHFSRVLIARFLAMPAASGLHFDMGTTGVAVLTYGHASFDEPVLAGLFSPKVHPHAPTHDAIHGAAAHAERQYLDLVADVIRDGHERVDRTGTGTRAIFAPPHTLKFSLRGGTIPLLTTKRVFFRGVLEELLWFIAGQTDAKALAARDVHIWDGNGSAEFLAARGLGHRREGDLGPVYGFQWRHFGAKYIDADTDYTGQGVDQLAHVIHQIKTNPADRRMILSAWNPADLALMALPPCHVLCQFFVVPPTPAEAAQGRRPQLSCQMYQRSCDLGLGVPFNIASYALLTHMIAAVTGCEAAEFTLAMGDAHVYRDHVEPLQSMWDAAALTPAQLRREPRTFPTLHIRRDVTDIDDFRADDFEVRGYRPHDRIDMRMSV